MLDNYSRSKGPASKKKVQKRTEQPIVEVTFVFLQLHFKKKKTQKIRVYQ